MVSEEHFQQFGVNKKHILSDKQEEMSTSLEADFKKQILGRPKAEKVFRPWWDTLEDYLLNALVLLGKHISFN